MFSRQKSPAGQRLQSPKTECQLQKICIRPQLNCIFVGASLLAMRGGQRVLPDADHRRQASSHKVKKLVGASINLYLTPINAAKNDHRLMPTIAGRPAPTNAENQNPLQATKAAACMTSV
jgi:hypothetical protein